MQVRPLVVCIADCKQSVLAYGAYRYLAAQGVRVSSQVELCREYHWSTSGCTMHWDSNDYGHDDAAPCKLVPCFRCPPSIQRWRVTYDRTHRAVSFHTFRGNTRNNHSRVKHLLVKTVYYLAVFTHVPVRVYSLYCITLFLCLEVS